MRHLQIDLVGQRLSVGFTRAATNLTLVREAEQTLRSLGRRQLLGGARILLVDGPVTLPVLATITHTVAHIYPAIAVRDPKLAGYVVAISHDPGWTVGDLVDDDGHPVQTSTDAS